MITTSTKKTVFVTALPAEGKAVAAFLQLKRRPGGVSVFENESFVLAVTGVGKTRCAAVTAAVLSQFTKDEIGAVVNVGIAGATDDAHPIGELYLIHQIQDAAAARAYFPDMLAASNLPEAMLITFDRVVDEFHQNPPQDGLVDMEAAGFYEAAALFAGPHQIVCLKIVSDHLKHVTSVTPDHVDRLVTEAMPAVMQHVQTINACIAQSGPRELNATHRLYLESLTEQYRFTQTQQSMLQEALRRYINAYPGLDIPKIQLEAPPPLTKNQRNKFVEQLRNSWLR